MATIGVGINGMGVLGRRLFRMIYEDCGESSSTPLEIKQINDPYTDPNLAKYLIERDTVYGRRSFSITVVDNNDGTYNFVVNGQTILYTMYKPSSTAKDRWANCNWGENNALYVIDCMGKYLTEEEQQSHISASANYVITCTDSTAVTYPIFVWGVNSSAISKDNLVIGIPSGDLIATSIMANFLNARFTILDMLCEHIVSYTNLNNLQDSALSKDTPQIGRAGAWNIIPCKSNVGKMLGLPVPVLNGKAQSFEHRCGTIAGSHTDLFANLKSDFDAETFYAEVKAQVAETISGAYKAEVPCMAYSKDTLETSSDTIGNPAVICNANNYTLRGTTFVRVGVSYDSISVQAANAILLTLYTKANF